ncbi:MAG: NCS1 family nucleobase:cation symporter-1 [Armatimonadetes bacterium]|nr:NCS1 family nucleobase:cation symporter-1 [Armatimonadota bacterium]
MESDGKVELSGELEESHLYNHDLAPTKIAQRTWTTYNYAALWIGMAHCIPTYQLASGLIAAGMNWFQAISTVLLGNLIVLIPMLLNSYAGTKYGVPFPVLCRSSFGVKGANLPALLRAGVACGWFGIQTWIGGAALNTLMAAAWDPWKSFQGGPWVCFFAFWLVNMWIIWKGMESVRKFENWAAPLILVVTLFLFVWMYIQAKGFGPIISQPSKFTDFPSFFAVFLPNLTANVAFWSTLSLNMPDFTRFSRAQKSQILGQALGLPTTMTLFAGLGIFITSATVVVFGEAIWDPIALLAKFNHPLVVVFSLFNIAVATLSVNVAANVVSPSFDFSNAWPRKIDFRLGGLITGVLGIAIMPWKLLSSYGSYVNGWLNLYAGVLGPVAGIMICDFWVVRKRNLKLAELYSPRGEYCYMNGWNPRALAAFVIGVACALGGIAIPGMHAFAHASWFIGFAVSFVLYWLLMAGQVSGKADR